MTFANAPAIGGLAYFRNGAWSAVGDQGQAGAEVTSVAFWDSDGGGPLPAQLFAGGRMVTSSGALTSGLGRWDGAQWHDLGAGLRQGAAVVSPTLLTTWDPDGDGPAAMRLAVFGQFGRANGLPAGCFAWLEPSRCCRADFNEDDFVDFFDYSDFVACYEGVDCATPDPFAADFNADGFVDFFDYSDFVAAFEAGC